MSTEANEQLLKPVVLEDGHLVASRIAVTKSIIKGAPDVVIEIGVSLAQSALANTVGAGLKRIALGKQPK